MDEPPTVYGPIDANSGHSDWTAAVLRHPPPASLGVHCCTVAVEHITNTYAGAVVHDDNARFSTATMAILRQLVIGVSSTRPVATRLVATRPSALAAARMLSTSSSRQAQHVHPDKVIQSTNARSHNIHASSSEEYKDPYKGGPSAIEKAVHLFFLTEILRGAPCNMK